MIELTPEHLIGKGRARFCYHHPADPDKCIKIDKRAIGGATQKEARYYQKLGRIRPHLTYSHIPRFYGYVETSLGPGGVFDLIRDDVSGEVSKSLSYYIRIGEVAVDDPIWLGAHRIYLKTLYEEAVIIRDFNPGNVCVRKLRDGSLRFITIDGIGHRFIFPFSDHWLWFARSKIRRQVARKNFGSIEEILARVAHKRKLFSAVADRSLE